MGLPSPVAGMGAAAASDPRDPAGSPLLRSLVLGLCRQAAGCLDPLPIQGMCSGYTELVGRGRQARGWRPSNENLPPGLPIFTGNFSRKALNRQVTQEVGERAFCRCLLQHA